MSDIRDIVGPRHCIVTGDLIGAQNDSKAHIIPSALGGRLKPRGILCRRGNRILDEKIDFPLIEAFQALMNLLNGSRDRGEIQPTRMTDENGKVYIFQFGEPLSLAKHEYDETSTDDGTNIRIEARTLKEARTLLGRVKAKHPEFDIEEAMRHVVVAREWPDGMLHHAYQIGPRVVFPAAFVAASIFAVHHGQVPHPQLKSFVSDFDRSDPIMPPDTFYFMPKPRLVTASGDVTHILALAGDAASGRLLAYVELFNLACIGVLLPFAGSTDIRKTFAVDVLSGTEVTPRIDESALRAVSWTATHLLGDEFVCAFTKTRFDQLVALAQKRSWDDTVTRMVKRALGSPDGRPMLAQDLANVAGEVAEFLKDWWKHPATRPDMRQQELHGFDGFCSQLASGIRPQARAEFHRLVSEHRRTLVQAAEIR